MNVSGVVIVEKHQITFYNSPRGYLILPIVVSNVAYTDDGKITKGAFLLKNDSLSVTMFITFTYIEYTLTEGYERERVKLKLRRQNVASADKSGK
jgi:hypothetical protein